MGKIRDLTQNNDNNSDVLSPETIDAIDGFKAEMCQQDPS